MGRYFGFDLTTQKLDCPAARHVLLFQKVRLCYRNIYEVTDDGVRRWVALYRCPACGFEERVARNKRGLVRRYRG